MDARALESFFISVELRGQDNCLVLSHNGEGRSHAELLKEYGFEVRSSPPFFFLVSLINFLLFVQARTLARQFLADQAAHPEKSVLKLLEQYQHLLPGYYQSFLVAEEVTFLSFSEDEVISWRISPDNDVFGSYPVPVSDLVVGERVILKLKSSVRHQSMRLKRKVEQVLSKMAYPVEFVDNTTPTTHIQILRGKFTSFKSSCYFIINCFLLFSRCLSEPEAALGDSDKARKSLSVPFLGVGFLPEWRVVPSISTYGASGYFFPIFRWQCFLLGEPSASQVQGRHEHLPSELDAPRQQLLLSLVVPYSDQPVRCRQVRQEG